MLQAGPASGLSETFTIINPHGLHARPGAMLVKVAKEYESDIRVANLDGSGEAVSAKSLMKVIGLGVKCGHRLAFRVEGPDAEAALKASAPPLRPGWARGALMDIVTITLNPALDLTTRLEAMSLGEVNLVSEANLRAAGRGSTSPWCSRTWVARWASPAGLAPITSRASSPVYGAGAG